MHRAGRDGVGLLLLLGLALAATPVTLPPGESAADWAEAFALAGLTAGSGGAVGVVITEVGGAWSIRVRDASGHTRETTVARPTTAGAREDVAWLVSSLVDAATVRGTAPIAAPPPAAPAPRVSTPAPTPPPAPVVTVAPPPPAPAVVTPPPLPEPVPPAPVEPPPAVVAAEPTPAPEVSLSLGVSSAVALKPGVAPGAALGFELGVVPVGALHLGVGVHGGLPATFTRLPGERRLSDVTLVGVAGWHPSGRVSPTVDVAGGVAWRQFGEDGRLVALAPFPTLEVAGGLALPLRSWFVIEPAVALAVDLRGADLVVDGGAPEQLSPWSTRLGVRLRSTFPVSAR